MLRLVTLMIFAFLTTLAAAANAQEELWQVTDISIPALAEIKVGRVDIAFGNGKLYHLITEGMRNRLYEGDQLLHTFKTKEYGIREFDAEAGKVWLVNGRRIYVADKNGIKNFANIRYIYEIATKGENLLAVTAESKELHDPRRVVAEFDVKTMSETGNRHSLNYVIFENLENFEYKIATEPSSGDLYAALRA